MSAVNWSNWAVCPRCRAARHKEKIRLHEAAARAYGAAPEAEYRKLFDEAEAFRVETIEKTFREDYSIDITTDGGFVVSYSGACLVCDLRFLYKHEVADIQKEKVKA